METPEPLVFEFFDYRDYILACLEARKRMNGNYSRREFARSIGFSSDSGLNMVLSRKRELRGSYLDSCIRELNLSRPERLYFEALVRAGRLSESDRTDILGSLRLPEGMSKI